MLRAVLLATLLVLAGCQAPTASPPGDDAATGTAPTTDATPADTATPTESPESALADPASDRLGWEDGVWYNETLAVNNTDGLNETELRLVVARSMARIEHVREREFTERVPVSVINRSTFRNRSSGNSSAALEAFDNGKFEALFLIGEGSDSIDEQEAALGQSVLGYYSPGRDEIVVVSDSQTPRLDGEGTLAHELVHALQDQQFDLSDQPVETRDSLQGRNGIIEGDAAYVEQRYMANCSENWSCLSEAGGSDGGGGGDSHFGLNFLMYFPYSDGPGFVADLHERGGWAAVDAAYEDRPDGATEVIYPDSYPEWEPTNVSLPDRSTDAWERVRPPNRPDHAVVGQSAIAASLAYTLTDDYNGAAVVSPREALNYEPSGALDRDDPYNYNMSAARGWSGGRMHVYENGDQSGYVWRTRWTNDSEATEFARTWELLVQHWGGEAVGENSWVIGEDSPFSDAVRIEQSGATVTVVDAPNESQLDPLHDA